tara:strand:+ start:681 stop:917 length:237 start_codon:yes stop_codon:yes gene_type:complete
MTLFCKQCNGRRVPIFQKTENISFWLCENCENFTDADDNILRELTELEKIEMKKELEDFKKDNSKFSKEKMIRRKGVN